jgi:hypothetical protein
MSNAKPEIPPSDDVPVAKPVVSGPDAADSAAVGPPVTGRHPYNWSMSGLPEMERFESDAQREKALEGIAAQFSNPLKGDLWIGIGILVAVVCSTWWVVRNLLKLVAWRGWVEDLLQWGSLAAVALFTLRALHRWGARADLRRKLREARVPVCLGCGYDLRGQPAESSRCPECGKEFDAEVREILREKQAAAAETTPPPAR